MAVNPNLLLGPPGGYYNPWEKVYANADQYQGLLAGGDPIAQFFSAVTPERGPLNFGDPGPLPTNYPNYAGIMNWLGGKPWGPSPPGLAGNVPSMPGYHDPNAPAGGGAPYGGLINPPPSNLGGRYGGIGTVAGQYNREGGYGFTPNQSTPPSTPPGGRGYGPIQSQYDPNRPVKPAPGSQSGYGQPAMNPRLALIFRLLLGI